MPDRIPQGITRRHAHRPRQSIGRSNAREFVAANIEVYRLTALNTFTLTSTKGTGKGITVGFCRNQLIVIDDAVSEYRIHHHMRRNDINTRRTQSAIVGRNVF